MECYEKTLVVEEEDLDLLQHVNNIRYVEWIQEVSKEHWESRASEKIKSEVVWVVLSHHVQYRKEAKLGDTIHIKTFIAQTKGAISVRAVEMRLLHSNTLLVESKTEWCLLNSHNLKPMRISPEIRSFFETNPKTPS